MPRTPTRQPLPWPVLGQLQRLGAAIRAARQRRRWSQALLAEKAGVALMTLRSAEQGRPGVTLATYVTLLWALNLNHLLESVADPAADRDGLALESGRLGERVRTRRELDDDF